MTELPPRARNVAITPGDLAATIYHFMGVPLDLSYVDGTGRPRPIVAQGGPIGGF